MEKTFEERRREAAVQRFGEDVVRAVEARGYTIGDYRGEGNTRTAVSVTYTRGEVRRKGIMKIPKLEVPRHSIQAQIAANKKRDWSLEEVLATNGLSHPNIIRPIDAFRLNGLGTAVVEDDLGEWTTDAETLMRRGGSFYGNGRAKEVVTDVTEAVEYLHAHGILHRDIKPSNVLIDNSGKALLSDLQTARTWKDVEESTMPTRGGTPYTHPRLINALLKGTPDKADRDTDMYSLGATVYSLITGEEPFSWKLKASEDGNRFVLSERKGLENEPNLVWDERELNEIDEDEHEKQLARMNDVMKSRNISRGWRNLVTRAMTSDPKKKPFRDLYDFGIALDDLNDNVYESAKEKFLSAARVGFGAGIAASLLGITLGGFLTLKSCEERNIPARTPSLTEDSYVFQGMRERKSLDNRVIEGDALNAELRRTYEALSEEHIVGEDKRFPDEGFGRWASDFHGIKPRIAYAIAIATRTAPDFSQEYAELGQSRLDWCFVPRSFIEAQNLYIAKLEKDDKGYQHDAAVASVLYLKDRMSGDRNPLDVFAHYFATSDQVTRAQIASGSVSYLPQYDRDGNQTERGYASALPQFQRDLIARAATFYQLIDEEGDIQKNRLTHLLNQSASSRSVVSGEAAK